MAENSETIWLTKEDIAKRSGYAPTTIQKYLANGTIKSRKVPNERGGRLWYKYVATEDDYIEWFNSWVSKKHISGKIGRGYGPQKARHSGDVVMVIRCKDCKHLKVCNAPPVHAVCVKLQHIFLPFGDDTRECFCSWAERKE